MTYIICYNNKPVVAEKLHIKKLKLDAYDYASWMPKVYEKMATNPTMRDTWKDSLTVAEFPSVEAAHRFMVLHSNMPRISSRIASYSAEQLETIVRKGNYKFKGWDNPPLTLLIVMEKP